MGELTAVHQYVSRHLADEIMWVASMPCGLPADDAIPLGQYGKSNVGRAKTVYRMGLLGDRRICYASAGIKADCCRDCGRASR